MMKYYKITLVATIINLVPNCLIAQSILSDYLPVTGNNYVRTFIPQRPTENPGDINLDNQATHKCVVTTQYFDGLGRPLQEVSRSAIGTGGITQADIVNIHLYDHNGRESVKFLPYSKNEATASNRGKLKMTPTDLNTQYATLYPGDQPFSRTVFDGSPLDRVVSTFAPGNAWLGTSHSVAYEYFSNRAIAGENIPNWTVGPLKSDMPVFIGNYADEQLFASKITDEDGVEIVEFKDKSDRLVFKKQKLGTSYLTTSFIYDDFGRLRYVITPEAFNNGITTASGSTFTGLINGFCYNYFYDKRGRLVEKTIPGKSVEYFVYDKYDRVVLHQDGTLRKCGLPIYTGPVEPPAIIAPPIPGNDQFPSEPDELADFGYKRIPPISETHPTNSPTPRDEEAVVFPSETSSMCSWYFTYYDVHDRVLMTGLYIPAYNFSREGMQEVVDNGLGVSAGSNYLLYYLYYDQFNAYHPTIVDAQIWTVNYYDDHSHPAMGGAGFNSSFNSLLTGSAPYATAPSIPSSLTKGLKTGSNVCVLDPIHALTTAYTTPWLKSKYFFDDKARLIQEYKWNHRGGLDLSTFQYNFGGSLASSFLQHTDGSIILYTNTNVLKNYNIDFYNNKPRLLTQKINAQAPENIYFYNYDELGRVLSKTQNIVSNKYRYNVRGWLTGINDEYFNASPTGIYFKEKLMYNNLSDYTMSETNTPLGAPNTYLNGNISQILWQHSGAAAKVRAYRYEYDDVNRVKNAKFSQRENLSGASWTWTDSHTDYTMWNVGYDGNGNIKTMNQMGDADVPSAPPIVMDQMTYNYFPNSNKLKGVSDVAVVSTNPDFKDDAGHSSDDFLYDENGNLIKDNNKGISEITYSHLDKPEHLEVTGKGKIDYVYDALGNRLQKKVVDVYAGGSPVTTTTDYTGRFIYKNNSLALITHEEGRSRPEGPVATPTFVNDYFVKDHLSNVRAVVTANAYFGIPDMSGTSSEASGMPAPGPISPVTTYLATHEIAAAFTEGALFNNIDPVRDANPSSIDSADLMAAVLDGADSAKRIGTSLMLRVMPGDQFTVDARNYYDEETDSVVAGTPDIVGGLLAALAGGTTYDGVPLADVPQNAQILHNTFGNPAFATGYDALLGSVFDPTRPAAYLNYIVLDEYLNIIPSQSGVIQVGPTAGTWNLMGTPSSGIKIEQPGYVVVFLSSATSRLVSFDRLRVVFYRGSVMEEDHYYPFGLNKAVVELSSLNSNKMKFITKELQKDEFVNAAGNKSGIELYDFGARMQDPQIGRWNGVDQLAEKYSPLSPYCYAANNPIKFVDMNGKEIHIYGIATSGLVSAIQSNTNMNVHYNNDSKAVTFSGFPVTGLDFFMLQAASDNNVNVNLFATDADAFKKEGNPAERPVGILVGGFGGSYIEGPTGRVQTIQYYNYRHSLAIEKGGLSKVGIDATHELVESYFGGVEMPGHSSETDNLPWLNIHNLVLSLDPNAQDLKVDLQGDYYGLRNNDWTKRIKLFNAYYDLRVTSPKDEKDLNERIDNVLKFIH